MTGALVVPACALTDVGETAIEKSAAAVMERLSAAEWLRVPLVPSTVSATVPAETLAGMTKDTWAEEPALIAMGQDGEQVAPDGSPATSTETEDENPLEPAMETVTVLLVVPAGTLRDAAETEMEKSGDGGGVVPDPELPQPIMKLVATSAQPTGKHATPEK
jgi:hypothetical protein